MMWSEKVKLLMLFPRLLIGLLALGGCATGNYDNSQEAHKFVQPVTDKKNNPSLMSMGTVTPVSPRFALTNIHVVKASNRLKAVSTHPHCDIALVEYDSSLTGKQQFRSPSKGEQIRYFGYSSFMTQPKESRGLAIIKTRLREEYSKPQCVMYASDAGVIVGMSGGAVYNTKDMTLGGIITGFVSRVSDIGGRTVLDTPSVFIPYESFKDWLNAALAAAEAGRAGPVFSASAR
ncbi:hypothetical protein ACFWP0_23025 [Achromobacter sp. NPDC058515]|uniref:hypothetical protein n=1 Tax=Achromobacter sp. NPDC058515 TaxID=3346533 RepID=UPI003658809C